METIAEQQLRHLKPLRKNGDKVKRVFEKVAKNISEGKPANVSTAMREEGYSPSSSNCLKVQRTATWQQLLDASLPDDSVMNVLRDLISPDNEDKRTRLEAAKEALKLKNRYPAEKKNFNIVKAELEDLFVNEEDRPTETITED
jgi:hypothetical protein